MCKAAQESRSSMKSKSSRKRTSSGQRRIIRKENMNIREMIVLIITENNKIMIDNYN